MTTEARERYAERLATAARALLAPNEMIEVDAHGPVREGSQVYVARLSVKVADAPGWFRVTGEVPPEPVEQAAPQTVAESILPQLRKAAALEMVRYFEEQG